MLLIVIPAASEKLNDAVVNIGSGEDLSIAELVLLVAEVVGWNGILKFDTSKPDGTPKKLLDISKLKSVGWSPKIDLPYGIEMLAKEYVDATFKTQ